MNFKLLIFLALFTGLLKGQDFQINALVSDSNFYDQRFGSSVAVYGNVAAVTASNAAEDGVRSGAVLIFEKNDKDEWEFSTKLRPADSKRLLGIGAKVALAKAYVFISARGNSRRQHYGSFVYVFRKEGNDWVETQMLKLEGGYQGSFGSNIEVDGNRVIVSANADLKTGTLENEKCNAFIYELAPDGLWALTGEIKNTELDGYQFLNQVIDLEGSHAFVNGYFEDTTAEPIWFCTMTAKDEKGKIIMQKRSPCRSIKPMTFVFTETNAGWVNTQILKPWDNEGGEFGCAISAHDGMLAVSAKHAKNTSNKSLAGKVYLYKIDANGIYQPFQIIFPKDSHYSQGFGSNLEFNDQFLIVASESDRLDENGLVERDRTGACYVFQKEANGQFFEKQKFVSPKRQKMGNYGRSIDLHENQIIVGSGIRRIKPKRYVMHDEGAAFVIHIDDLEPNRVQDLVLETPALAETLKREGEHKPTSRTIVLYPNPASTEFILLRSISAPSKVSVLDLNGRKLVEYEFEGFSKVFKLKDLSAGVYLVKVESQGRIETMKLIVKH